MIGRERPYPQNTQSNTYFYLEWKKDQAQFSFLIREFIHIHFFMQNHLNNLSMQFDMNKYILILSIHLQVQQLFISPPFQQRVLYDRKIILIIINFSQIIYQSMTTCNKCGNEYEGNQCSPCKKLEDCKYFLNGTCKYGDDCKYNHQSKKKKENCKFYVQGECKFGSQCKYNHPMKNLKQDCKYFIEGQCKYGDNCKFNHPFIKKKQNCKFYMKEKCKYGSNCNYSHPYYSGKCKNCGTDQFVDKKIKVCFNCHQNVSQI